MHSGWMAVRTWAELAQALSASRHGVVRLPGHGVRRVHLESKGSLFVYGYMRRRYGSRYVGWPPEWNGSVVEVRPVVVRSRGERLTRHLRLWARYILRHTPPDVWTDLRGLAEAVTPARLRALVAMVDQGADEGAALQQLGLPADAPRYRTTTLRSEGAREALREHVKAAFEARRAFEVGWTWKYDCSARGELGADGVYRAWLSTERRGLAHGHYWLLLDGFRAVYCESD